MTVSYGGTRPKQTVMQYRCARPRETTEGRDCQVVGGKRIDTTVVQVFLEATQPAAIEAAVLAEEQSRQQGEALARTWQLQIEKAEYAAQRAERQYQAVEPENRVVARELERRWNECLVELESVRAEAQRALQCARPLSELERARARSLAADLEAVWNAETTTNRDRKRLLRCLIEEVQLRTEARHYAVRILWKGGAITDREVVRRPRGTAITGTPEDTLDLVRKLAAEFDDAQIARILNKQGRRTGLGNPFTAQRVRSLRSNHGISAPPKTPARDLREGPFTADEAAVELGVAMVTIHRWLREGVLAGHQTTPGAPWRIVLNEDVRRRLNGGDVPQGWVGLDEASRRLGLSKSLVAHMVKRGKLRAMRTTVGKRRVWKIDVTSTDCGRQPGLFDQMRNDESKES